MRGGRGGGGGGSIRRICIIDSEQSLYRNLSLNPSRCVVGWERVRGGGGVRRLCSTHSENSHCAET